MGFSGTLRTFPMPDLFQWLGSGRKTGTLAVRNERCSKRIYVKEGRIISSASDEPTEQLGHFLVSRGRITEEQLRKGLKTQAETRVLLGKILVTVGVVTEPDLKQLLVMKAEETILSLFLLPDAHFEFHNGELPREMFVPISLDVSDLLTRGSKMVEELRRMRGELGPPATVLGRTDKPLPEASSQEHCLDRVVLTLVDGRRSIADLCLALHASEFTVSKMLQRLKAQGYLKVLGAAPRESGPDGAGERPPVSAGLLVSKARERLAVGAAEEAMDLLKSAVAEAPQDHEARRLRDRARAAFREQAYASMPPFKVPVLRSELSQLTGERLRPEEVFLLSRINGSWDLRSIIDISPLAEVEALRILKRLKDRGIIEFW